MTHSSKIIETVRRIQYYVLTYVYLIDCAHYKNDKTLPDFLKGAPTPQGAPSPDMATFRNINMYTNERIWTLGGGYMPAGPPGSANVCQYF